MSKKTFLCLAFICFAVSVAWSAPKVKTYTFGDFTFTAMQDAEHEFDTSLLLTNRRTQRIVNRLVPSGKTPGNIMIFLLQIPSNNILFDTGLGQNTEANLAKVGLTPADINNIFITHLHPDHFGGLVQNGYPVFPNATVHVSQAEFDYWIGQIQETRAMKALEAYSDRVLCFDMGDTFFDAITVLDASGHTPGHTTFLIESQGKKLAIIGDMIHINAVQFARPDIAIRFDVDPVAAARRRLYRFREFSRRRIAIAGMHILFPGVGYLSEYATGFQFTPITGNKIN